MTPESALHGEMLEPLYLGTEDPAASYEWMPARPAAAEFLALDRLTLAAVTTGMVDLPSGDRVHAGIWLRTMRTLIDEITRLWRDAGRPFHWSLGRLVPFEAMLPERRELVLTITAGAILAFAPDLRAFKSGRNFAAWLDLVPRQHSTGGKPRLGGISKMGQTDIRKLLIVGAESLEWWLLSRSQHNCVQT